jgi:outer membrane protein TolC
MKHSLPRLLPICVVVVAGCASWHPATSGLSADAFQCAQAGARLTATDAALLAIANSPELSAEGARLDLRKDAWRLGIRAWMPKLTFACGDDERVSLYGPDSHTRTLSARVDQPVWDGGRLAAARTLENADLALSTADHERSLRQVGEIAITAYRSVLASRARLAIRKGSLAASVDERAIIAAEVALGLAIANDLSDADLQIADMDSELTVAEMALSVAEDQLIEALGLDGMPVLADELSLLSSYPSLDAGRAACMAAERSPEVASARHEVEKKRAQAKAAMTSWLPTIGLIASAQVSGATLPLTRGSWSVGLSVDFAGPLASGGSAATIGGEPPFDTSAQTQHRLTVVPDPTALLNAPAAAVDLALQEQLLARLMARARRTARAAIVSLELAERKRDAAARALELADSRLRLARLLASMGQAVHLEPVKAELARAEKAIDLVDAAAAMVVAARELERLLDMPPGGLLADGALLGDDAGGTTQ